MLPFPYRMTWATALGRVTGAHQQSATTEAQQQSGSDQSLSDARRAQRRADEWGLHAGSLSGRMALGNGS
jgi:hypothetical protein